MFLKLGCLYTDKTGHTLTITNSTFISIIGEVYGWGSHYMLYYTNGIVSEESMNLV